jgi:hypothetical protein
MRIGLIADTHGILEARVLEIFRGVERILHAGDVGGEEILEDLSRVAPVTAVRGNTDVSPVADRLRDVEVASLAGRRFLLTHQVGRPGAPGTELRRLVAEHQAEVVVFGHTHAPFDRIVDGVRYLNPGGSGPRRFRLPRTVAVLDLTAEGVDTRFVDLDRDPGGAAGCA